MRTVIYNVPAFATLAVVASDMICQARKELKVTPGEDIQVVSEFNGIEIAAHSGSTIGEIIYQWHDKRHKRTLRDERLMPVRVAIRYLLGTLSEEDRQLVGNELFVISKMKEGA